MMGLDYATGGTMTVAGRKLVVIDKDDQGKPDVGKSLLAAPTRHWTHAGPHFVSGTQTHRLTHTQRP